MEAENRVVFSLVSIHEEKFEIREISSIDAGDLKVQYLIETEIDPDGESVFVRTGVRYMMEDAIICECILGIRFSIENFHKMVSVDEVGKKINFASNFMPTFLGITYGALRGALFERVKDTPMALYPLPLISMEELEKSNHFKVVRVLEVG